MSLITVPKHLVTVVNRVASVDADGVEVFTDTHPVSVPCNVCPVSANESEQYGLVLTDSYRITCAPDTWPGEPGCSITWDGLVFIQVGRVRRSRRGHGTRADRLFMQRGQNGEGV